MSTGKYECCVDVNLVGLCKFRVGSVCLNLCALMAQRKPGNTIDDKVFTSQGTGLVKASNINTSRKRNAERLRAKDCELAQRRKTRVNSKTQFHGKLRRDHARDDENTVEEQLRPLAVLRHTLLPHIPRSSKCEHEQEQNEKKSLHIVCRDTLCRIDHGAHQVTLACLESGLHNDA